MIAFLPFRYITIIAIAEPTIADNNLKIEVVARELNFLLISPF